MRTCTAVVMLTVLQLAVPSCDSPPPTAVLSAGPCDADSVAVTLRPRADSTLDWKPSCGVGEVFIGDESNLFWFNSVALVNDIRPPIDLGHPPPGTRTSGVMPALEVGKCYVVWVVRLRLTKNGLSGNDAGVATLCL